MAQLIHPPEKVSKDHYLLKILFRGKAPEPGQFINIRAGEGTDPLLRRPFSVFDFNEDILSIIVRVVGRGTKAICEMPPDEMDILGPRGRGFTLSRNAHVLLVGGGVGNAPLFFLAKLLKDSGCRITCIYGHRNEEYIYKEEEFRKYTDEFILVTDDGSRGIKGFAADPVRDLLKKEKIEFIYTCGPLPMMERVAFLAGENIPVEVSLENYFGCGIGLCMGCTVETKEGRKRACVDGPVMKGSLVDWESIKMFT